MIPGARLAAVMELCAALDAAATAPADAVIGNYFRARRYIGSKDRGWIAELTYGVLRLRNRLLWLAERMHLPDPEDPRTLVLVAALELRVAGLRDLESWCTGRNHCPEPLTPQEARQLDKLAGSRGSLITAMPEAVCHAAPAEMLDALKARFGADALPEAMAALNVAAPVDLRVNLRHLAREAVQAQLASEGITADMTPLSPAGLRIATRAPVFGMESFRQGHYEVQDEGSQLAALLVDARPGQKVVDFCAGAGGKTLALADHMRNRGRILALDVAAHRLEQLRPRLKRARVDTVTIHAIRDEADPFLKRHKRTADRVLVDAPCSGSGTWRRNPDLKWRVTAASIAELQTKQTRILASAARLVKPGGRLVYVTCSLFGAENEDIAQAFGAAHAEFTPLPPAQVSPLFARWTGPHLALAPHTDHTDGFFAAVWERSAGEGEPLPEDETTPDSGAPVTE